MRTIALLALIVAATLTATAAAKSPPKKVYWTTAQANAAVLAQAKVPYCKVGGFACTNGVPNDRTQIGAIVGPKFVTCSGMTGFQSNGKYSRFTCAWQGNNQVGHGTLQVFTASSTKIRWKSV